MRQQFVLCMMLMLITSALAQTGAKNGEWRTYGGDLGNTHYSPLSQIDASNFNKLTVAWAFKTDNLGPRPEYQFEGTPLMVNGVLYSTGGTRRAVFALDAATGIEHWKYDPYVGVMEHPQPKASGGVNRGVAYWSHGKQTRILLGVINVRP